MVVSLASLVAQAVLELARFKPIEYLLNGEMRVTACYGDEDALNFFEDTENRD
jgi:hypothetical protein